MKTIPFQLQYLSQVEELHGKFFDKQFPIDSLKNLIGAYLAIEDNEIIAFGCNRLITESITITDLSKSVRIRRTALKELLDRLLSNARANHQDGIHCFIDYNEQDWIQQLERNGFNPTIGKALYHRI